MAAYDFPAAGIVVDVGGGQGSLLTAILEANTGLHGILFERQPVVKMERPRVEEAGLTDRCDLVAGDFFDAVPACGDLYLLKKVIHDWSDEAAHWILSRCYAAMPPNARLLVSDSIVPAGNRPSPGKWLDLLMLVYAGGRERTETEFRDLLTSAGFRLNRVI